MTDLDEGRLLAYLDDELDPDDRVRLEARLEESASVRETFGDIRRRRDLVADSLDRLPVVEVDMDAARRRMGERTKGGGSDTGTISRRAARRGMAQAAMLVLLLGGAAAAAVIPGSPVRAWLTGAEEEGPPAAGMTAETGGVDDAAIDAADDVGIRVRPAEGRLEIDLASVPASWEVVVRLVDDAHGAVYAPRATFSSSAGAIGMRTVAGGDAGAGTVRVEIPRWATAVVLRADGRVLMEKDGERLDFPGPTARVSGDTIRFGGVGG